MRERSQTIWVRDNLKQVEKELKRKEKKHLPKATADALNNTAKKVVNALKAQTKKRLDRPKPVTVNAYTMSRASPKYLDATVYIKDGSTGKKKSPNIANYLKYVIDGGIQRNVVIPMPQTPLDQYGNIKGKSSKAFFRNKVYQKISVGTGVFDKKGNLLAVIKDVNYTKKLLPFFKIGEGVVKNVLPKQLKLAIKVQMAKK